MPTNQKRVYQIHRQHMMYKRRQDNWRSLKVTDPSAFNAGAQRTFKSWLAQQINASPTKSVALGWTVDNAAFVLDVNIETAKRYLRKFTSDAAPFESDGSEIWMRGEK
jgi:hypothetical protein